MDLTGQRDRAKETKGETLLFHSLNKYLMSIYYCQTWL
jgi:hypothetical protein